VRTVRYREIADDLRRRVEGDEFAPNRPLPSEAELSRAYAASRVTVRRALDELREVGLVEARQGAGWFVAGDPLVQSLGRLGTIEAQLSEAGIVSERRVLDFAFVSAPMPILSKSWCRKGLLGPGAERHPHQRGNQQALCLSCRAVGGG